MRYCRDHHEPSLDQRDVRNGQCASCLNRWPTPEPTARPCRNCNRPTDRGRYCPDCHRENNTHA